MADTDETESKERTADAWGPAAPVPPSADDVDGERGTGHSRRKLLGRLAGGLAHEIKNPLSTMAINLTLLEEEFQPAPGGDGVQSPKDKRSLKRVHTLQREISRLEGILDDFLHYARGGEINRAPGDLVALIREVLEFAAPELEAENVRLHASLPNALPLAMLDSGAFRQVLMNLLVNARQAMPGGGELIVELRRSGARAELAITDSGVGMTEDQLEHCFDLYFSTKRGGTGLGLATVRRIIEMHDGEIGVQSEAGRGTRFLIWLPLLQEIPITKGAQAPPSAESEP
ncbi:Sensor protein ZraS [Planctomycetes bacterium Poly30]|uniref:histidine kinase n=1 Tax=Saltatorellus ferox TaxID=2528018 RepID=A0A518ESS2_9BACT|nr:Sensor protein ZraS [Planctomycetes bacterium Poly30]